MIATLFRGAVARRWCCGDLKCRWRSRDAGSSVGTCVKAILDMIEIPTIRRFPVADETKLTISNTGSAIRASIRVALVTTVGGTRDNDFFPGYPRLQ